MKRLFLIILFLLPFSLQAQKQTVTVTTKDTLTGEIKKRVFNIKLESLECETNGCGKSADGQFVGIWLCRKHLRIMKHKYFEPIICQ